MGPVLKLSFLMVFLVCIAQAFATVSVSDCNFQIDTTDTYQLTQNITCPANQCINVTVNDSIVDLNGYKITYNISTTVSALFDFGANGCTVDDTGLWDFTTVNGTLSMNAANRVATGTKFCDVLFNNVTLRKGSGTTTRGFFTATSGNATCVTRSTVFNNCTFVNRGSYGLIGGSSTSLLSVYTNNVFTDTYATSGATWISGNHYNFTNNTFIITNDPGVDYCLLSIAGTVTYHVFKGNNITAAASAIDCFISKTSTDQDLNVDVVNNNFYTDNISTTWALFDEAGKVFGGTHQDNYYNFSTPGCNVSQTFSVTGAGGNYTDTNTWDLPSKWLTGCGASQTCNIDVSTQANISSNLDCLGLPLNFSGNGSGRTFYSWARIFNFTQWITSATNYIFITNCSNGSCIG